MIPLCPALLAARASVAIGGCTSDGDGVYGGIEYSDPTKAPGVACIGSRCAKWVPHGAIPAPNSYTATTPPKRDPSRGCCSDNPFAEPWENPATPTPTEVAGG